MTDQPEGRAARAARILETTLLCALLFSLLLLGCAQIVLRNLFDTALLWADPLVRAGVLWLGLLGAVAAAREARHIRVDLAQRFLRGWPRRVLDGITNAFTAVVCAVIAWHGTRLVIDERAFGGGSDFIPSWILQIVIPASFGIMALLHAAHVVRPPKVDDERC